MRGAGTGWNRGQAIQIGALLLFAILVISLSLFQVLVVPDQNGEIEYKHSQEVRSDMLGARNAVLDAGTGDQSFVEVDLAPSYPSRSLFVNPAEPAGTVRTTAPQSITVINDTGGTNDDISSDACPGAAETRALEYDIGYNVYAEAPTYRVENTVLFRDFSSDTLPGSGQQLVTDDSINLLPLRNEFSESGTGTATVEPVPGGVLTTTVTDPRIELPTEYGEELWRDILEGPIDRQNVTVSGGNLILEPEGTFLLYCTPVGINGEPPSGARQGGLAGSGSDSGGGINPAETSEVRLTGVSKGPTKNDVTITLKNADDEAKSLARGRIPFYYAGSGGSSTRPSYADLDDDPRDRLEIRERLEVIDQDITLGAGSKVTLTFHFDETARDDFYVFDVSYDDGTTATYYIDTPQSQGGGRSTATATPTSTPTSTGAGFQSVSASNLNASTTGGETQTLTFAPDQDLASGETVEINLSDAQDATSQNTNQYQVDYRSSNSNLVQGAGSVQFTTQNSTNAVVTFTSGGVSAGETVEIELSSITTGSNGAQNGPYDVVFDRSDGTSETTTFAVN